MGVWELTGEVIEVESGKRADNRPQLQEALRLCRTTGATLVVAKLDRLSRDAAFLMQLQNAGVSFVAADMPGANSFTVGVMALVAQQEREAVNRRPKRTPYRRAKGTPFVEQRNGYDGRTVRAGCGVGRA
ncbi:recombinase family protein [Sphingomonas sp. WKB10]|nr:recombinase family protein [Sphingomonas sp. WKB10]